MDINSLKQYRKDNWIFFYYDELDFNNLKNEYVPLCISTKTIETNGEVRDNYTFLYYNIGNGEISYKYEENDDMYWILFKPEENGEYIAVLPSILERIYEIKGLLRNRNIEKILE